MMRIAIGAIFLLLLAATTVRAQDRPAPAEVQDITIDEKPDAPLPLDAKLMDEMGNETSLRKCIAAGKPAVLQLGYFGCPMLCDNVSRGLLKSLKELDLNIGSDFGVIYVSFDPRETYIDANQKKLGYVKAYDRPAASSGWHFLVGSNESVQSIADAVGFKYRWVESSKQFAHPAVLVVLTPDGRVSRYLYGVEFPKRTLQLSLVEASQGKIGSTVDRVMMLCYRYDSKTGQYTFFATNLMRIAGAITVAALGTWIARMLLKERRERLNAT